jgi:hypothetical protein
VWLLRFRPIGRKSGENTVANFIFDEVERLRVITATQLPYKTGLAKLFKSAIVFSPALAQADLAAIEADFTGYAAITETTLPLPYLDLIKGGVSFQVPTLPYQVASPATVGNQIYGGWFETAGGVLLMAWQLANPWSMQQPFAAMNVDLIVNMYGSNQVYVAVNGDPQ